MSKKRRKPRPRAAPERPAQERPAEAAPEQRPRRSEVPGFLGWLAPRAVGSSFPPIRSALGRGAVAAGSSAIVLVLSFAFVFLAWLGLVGLGLEGPPGRLVNLAALPPISTYFDALNGITIYGYGALGLGVSLGFLVVRSAFIAVVTTVIVQAFEGGGSPLEALRRALRAIPVVLAVNIMSLSMMISGSIFLPFLGAGFGFLGSILILVAALFFFAFAPAAAVREDRSLLETIRRGGRAALMPGSRHLLMCMLYVFLALPILVAFAPGGSLNSVNPSLAMWVYGFATTFVHVAFLAAFAYRWMGVEAEVPDRPVKRRRR